jgi:PAS domain-containing protein
MLDSGGLVGLALLRSSRDGPCTPEVLAAFARVAHQAHRAVRVQLALGQERGEAMLSSLAQSGEMTLLLDRHGRLVAMTEAAEALFDCPLGLRLDGLSIRLEQGHDDRALKAAVGRLLASDGVDGPVVHQTVVGRSDQRPEGLWRLFLTRIPVRHDVIGVEAQLALTLRPCMPA